MLFASQAGLKRLDPAQNARMSTPDPGLDRHEWETAMEALEPELEDSPTEALPELDALVARMMAARGLVVEDAVADEVAEPEIVAQFRAARELARAADRGDEIGPGDVAAAINGYRAIYDYLIAERTAP
jgi:hypothetical protein